MKILVVGGAGYIGSHVVYDLIDAGHQVTTFDNLSLGLRENIDARATFVKGDYRSATDLEQVFQQSFDAVFHFGALKAAGDSMVEPERYADSNIAGTINLLGQMSKHNVKKIIFSSSAAVYGEPEYLPLDEAHSLKPINFYGYTKLAIEEILGWYSRLKGLSFAALRYFNATGYDISGRVKGKERDPNNLSPIVMEALAGERPGLTVYGNDYETPDGTCIRDYIHVNDLASAHIAAMNYLFEKNQSLTVNLGTGRGYSVLELIAAAEQAAGQKVQYTVGERRAGDAPELVADSSLARELLGWQPENSDMLTIMKSMVPVYL